MTKLQKLKEHFEGLLPMIVGDRRGLVASHIATISAAVGEIKSLKKEVKRLRKAADANNAEWP